MFSFARLGNLLLAVGLIIGGLIICFNETWSLKLAWGFLFAAGICFALVALELESLMRKE